MQNIEFSAMLGNPKGNVVALLADFYSPDIVQDPKYKFSQSGTYYAPPKSEYDQYVEFIKVQ